MKKLILSACVALAGAFCLNAQNLSYRVEVGGNIAGKYVLKGKSPDYKYAPVYGARVGLALEYALSPNMYLASGLNYRMAGLKTTVPQMGKRPKMTITDRDHNLSLPINFGGRFQVARDFALSLEGGPFVAWTFSAKRDMGVKAFDNKDRKRLEFGAGIALAAEYQNRYFLRIGTDYGLTNIKEDTRTKLETGSNEVYLTFGVRF